METRLRHLILACMLLAVQAKREGSLDEYQDWKLKAQAIANQLLDNNSED